jgi:Tfp pilus assembly protein PilN
MKAINLIPSESRRRGLAGGSTRASLIVVAALVLTGVMATIYVLTGNTISDRKAQLATINSEVATATAKVAALAPYTQFAALARTRESTVREIAAARFDWNRNLTYLAQAIPSGDKLASLTGTVAPGASSTGAAGGGAAGGGAAVRPDLNVPAFELTGCAPGQDGVAGLMSRLRAIPGATRVTLEASAKPAAAQQTTTSAQPTAAGSSCSSRSATFNLVVFFTPIPNAGPTGVTPGAQSTTGSSSAVGASAATPTTATKATTSVTAP